MVTAVESPTEAKVWACVLACVEAGAATADEILSAVEQIHGEPGLDVLRASLSRMIEPSNGKETAC